MSEQHVWTDDGVQFSTGGLLPLRPGDCIVFWSLGPPPWWPHPYRRAWYHVREAVPEWRAIGDRIEAFFTSRRVFRVFAGRGEPHREN